MRLVATVLAVAALTAAAPATASPRHVAFAVRVQHALVIARDYWHTAPPCGQVQWSWAQVNATRADALGEAVVEQCTIHFLHDGIAARPPGTMSWPYLCLVVAHEYGHLVFGLTYFAAINPADPAHSPNPDSVMSIAANRPPQQCWMRWAGYRSGFTRAQARRGWT